MSETLAGLFASGRAVDFVLLVLVIEALWLTMRRRGDVLPALVPGALILLAVRAALTGSEWWVVAGWLALSLPAHLYDLRRRLTSASSDRR